MPDCSAQLLEQVQIAISGRTPLRIAGGNSKQFMGRQATGELLSTAPHSGIVEYEPTELVITARSGTTIKELNTTLSGHAQCLGCEPPESGGATIGGALACNQSGPARPWLGSIRDHVLGIRLINGRGEQLRFGGRVMKNVAGYDVSRLQAGAMGTLGVMTEVTLRVFPKPEQQATVVLNMDAQKAIQLMNAESGRGGPLSGACWVDGQLYMRYSGCESAVHSRAWELGGATPGDGAAFWLALREQQLDFFQRGVPLWRLSSRSASAHCDQESQWLIDWGGSQRWQYAEADLATQESVADELGGQATLYRGGKREDEVFHSRTKLQKQLHLRVKQAFDPLGLFNPGRLYQWM